VVVFTCANEERGFLTWDVYDGNIVINSFLITSYQVSRIFSRRLEQSVMTAEVTYKNSTALVSRLTIYNFSSSSANVISCNGVRVDIAPPQAFSCKSLHYSDKGLVR